MSGVDCQAFVQRLNCNCQIIPHTKIGRLNEIVIRCLSLNFWSSCGGHTSQFHSYRIKRPLMMSCILVKWPCLVSTCPYFRKDFDSIRNDLMANLVAYISSIHVALLIITDFWCYKPLLRSSSLQCLFTSWFLFGGKLLSGKLFGDILDQAALDQNALIWILDLWILSWCLIIWDIFALLETLCDGLWFT